MSISQTPPDPAATAPKTIVVTGASSGFGALTVRAAKAAMDALAVSYAGELIRFGIGTSIVVRGAFTSGTNHFAHAGAPADSDRENAYEEQYGTLRSGLCARNSANGSPH
jgi:NAD(P)-dependent dehydrogenase (short-subunit alcohol dehydrogenase family)